MDAAELRAMQAPIKERYKADPDAAVITLKAEGCARRCQHRLQGRNRPGAGGRRPASGDRRFGHGTLLRRHAAGGAGGLRRRDLEGGGDRARHSAEVRAPCRPRAISIFAARSASPRTRRWASAQIRLRFDVDTEAPQEQARPAPETDRALLRGLPDHRQGPAGGHQASARVISDATHDIHFTVVMPGHPVRPSAGPSASLCRASTSLYLELLLRRGWPGQARP